MAKRVRFKTKDGTIVSFTKKKRKKKKQARKKEQAHHGMLPLWDVDGYLVEARTKKEAIEKMRKRKRLFG